MSENHRLPREDFEALAAGGGGAGAVAVLRAGQLSKYTVMILAIVELAPERCPDATGVLEEAYEVLVTAQMAAPAAVESVLAHPSVGSWADRCLRRVRGTLDDPTLPLATELGQLATVAAAAAIRAGLSIALTVPARDGRVFLPTLGLATVESPNPGGRAVIRHDGGQTTIRAAGNRSPDAVVFVPAAPACDAPGWLGLRHLRAEAAGLTTVVELDDIDPQREGPNENRQGYGPANRLSHSDVARWQRALDMAWQELACHHREQAEAIAAGLVSFIPIAEPEASTYGTSGTARNAFGRVMLTPPRDGLSLGATLVHEFHHSKLNAVMDLVPLHDAQLEMIYYAPWRDDPRPLVGLLHGTYAFIGVTDYWQVQRHTIDGPQRRYAEFEFALWRWQVRRATQVLLESGKLTDAGVDFVGGMAAKADSWQRMAVPDDVQRLADRCAEEHETRWRLRNLVADPDAIRASTRAWRRGEPCPLAVSRIPTSVVPQQQRPSDRDSLVRTWLAQPDRFEALRRDPAQLTASGLDVTDADIAFVRGDLDAAYARYLAEVTSDVDQVDSFAGLVVAGRAAAPNAARNLLAAVPERVWAVYRQIVNDCQPEIDLDTLLGWLAGGEEHGRGKHVDSRPRVGQAVR